MSYRSSLKNGSLVFLTFCFQILANTKAVFFGILMIMSCVAFAQQEPYELPLDPTNQNIIPPAPESWLFMQYGEYPVSRETGVPNISIPLLTVTQGNLSVPITLTYHASGVKVDQKSSWVGLSWNLTSGGMISRTVKGHPDEFPHGYLARGVTYREDFVNPTEGDAWIDILDEMEIQRLIVGERDLEPDEFTVNVPGYSATLFLDRNNQPFAITQPYSDVRIEYKTDINHPSGHIIEFTITTPEGTIYKFGQPSTTTYYPRYQLESVSCNSTWYLLEMTNTNGTDVISFTYKQNPEYGGMRWMETEYLTFKYAYEQGGYMGYESSSKMNEIPYTYGGVKVIDEILFNMGKVKFNSQTGRSDDTGHRLVSLDIYGKDKVTVIKGFDFEYGYFNSFGSETEFYNKRLKLISLTERGLNGEKKPPYEFTYLETGLYQLPPRFSFSQDYWGYDNGRLNNSLVPEYYYSDPLKPVERIKMGKANREPDAEQMKSGIIQKIQYPTMGYTEFEFQANDVKRSYNKTTYTPFNFDATITPTSSVTESTENIPESGVMTETVQAIVEYEIRQISGEDPEDPIGEGEMYVALIDLTDNNREVVAHSSVMELRYSQQIELEVGHAYQLVATSDIDQQTKIGMAQIVVYWYETSIEQVTENKIVGGLRVKSTKNFDESGTLVTQKFYDYSHPDDPDYSSAVYNAYNLPDPSNYVNTSIVKYLVSNPDPTSGGTGTGGGTYDCVHHEDITKSLTYSASHQEGFPIGDPVTYEYVTEYLYDYENESEGIGKVTYQYAVALDQTIPALNSFNLDRSWQRGQLLHEKYFASDNQTVVKEITYDYELIDNVHPEIPATRINQTWSLGNDGQECFPQACECFEDEGNSQRTSGKYFFTPFSHIFQWKRLKSVTETMDAVTRTTTLSYEEDPTYNHSNVIASEVENSNGKATRTEIRYAHETNDAELIDRNMTGVPLQSDVFVNGQLVGGSRLAFDHFGRLYLPKRFEERLSSGDYRLVSEVDEVNLKGRTTMSHTKDGVYSSILWAYDDELPGAKVINNTLGLSTVTINPFHVTAQSGIQLIKEFTVDFPQEVVVSTTIDDVAGVIGSNSTIYKVYVENTGNSTEVYTHNLPGSKTETLTLSPGTYNLKANLSLSQTQNILTDMRIDFKASGMFYTSFEETDGVLDPDARTGQKVHVGNYTIDGNILVEGAYLLSYWTYADDKWTTIQSTINHDGISDITISATGKLDEVRIHPVGSQMQTINYDPVHVRVITQSDVNSTSSSFDYDDLGRLKLIRDNDHNIVQSHQYRYKGQE